MKAWSTSCGGRWLTLVATLCLPISAMPAELAVIHEGPGAVPVGTYLGHLVAGIDQPGVLPGTRFPITTGLKAAAVSPPDRSGLFESNWLAHPIVVLGTDDLSLRWLQQHRQTLIELGASGLVIEASSETAFKNLQALAAGLSVAPVRGAWLEQTLLSGGFNNYPLVIMSDGRVTGSPIAAGEAEGAVK